MTAPGVDILAAAAPEWANGDHFALFSGTSMASPHVAGLGALLKSKHPDWSPMAIKSALMTTAYQRNKAGKPIDRVGGTAPATALDYGAGHVNPAPAFDPGLVYDSTATEWLAYLCGLGHLAPSSPSCRAAGSIDASDLNLASIAVGDLGQSQKVTRRVTNVSGRLSAYRAAVEAPAGFTVTVSPEVLVVPAGETRSFTVTVTRTTAPAGVFAFGSLTWRDLAGHAVRSPIALRANG